MVYERELIRSEIGTPFISLHLRVFADMETGGHMISDFGCFHGESCVEKNIWPQMNTDEHR